MGQPVPSSQPENSDAGSSRCGHRCGCESVDRDSATGHEAGPDPALEQSLLENDPSVALVGAQHGVPFVVQSGRALFMVANNGPHPLDPSGIARGGPHLPVGDPEGTERERSMDLIGNAYDVSQWVVAELRFDTAACIFVEVSRVHYDWPREAFGSMLARVAVGDEIDHALIDRVTTDFSIWLAAQFGVVQRP